MVAIIACAVFVVVLLAVIECCPALIGKRKYAKLQEADMESGGESTPKKPAALDRARKASTVREESEKTRLLAERGRPTKSLPVKQFIPTMVPSSKDTSKPTPPALNVTASERALYTDAHSPRSERPSVSVSAAKARYEAAIAPKEPPSKAAPPKLPFLRSGEPASEALAGPKDKSSARVNMLVSGPPIAKGAAAKAEREAKEEADRLERKRMAEEREKAASAAEAASAQAELEATMKARAELAAAKKQVAERREAAIAAAEREQAEKRAKEEAEQAAAEKAEEEKQRQEERDIAELRAKKAMRDAEKQQAKEEAAAKTEAEEALRRSMGSCTPTPGDRAGATSSPRPTDSPRTSSRGENNERGPAKPAVQAQLSWLNTAMGDTSIEDEDESPVGRGRTAAAPSPSAAAPSAVSPRTQPVYSNIDDQLEALLQEDDRKKKKSRSATSTIARGIFAPLRGLRKTASGSSSPRGGPVMDDDDQEERAVLERELQRLANQGDIDLNSIAPTSTQRL